jgi:hypothetical protein
LPSARSRDVHVDGVELLHGREQGRLRLLDVGALGHRGAADPPRHRRGHHRVAQVDLGGLDRGAAGGDVGLGRLQLGDGVVVILLAHRVLGDELGVALRLQARRRDGRLGARELRLRGVERGLVRRGVDDEEPLPLLHVAALREEPLLDDAVHARAHLRDAIRGGAARQLLRERHRRRRERHDAHLDRTGGRRRGLLAATGEQGEPEGEEGRRLGAHSRFP